MVEWRAQRDLAQAYVYVPTGSLRLMVPGWERVVAGAVAQTLKPGLVLERR